VDLAAPCWVEASKVSVDGYLGVVWCQGRSRNGEVNSCRRAGLAGLEEGLEDPGGKGLILGHT